MTSTRATFSPPQHPGALFQATLALLLMVAAGALYYRAALLPIGGTFLLTLLLALVLTVPVPFLLYGLYALRRASYEVNRDRIKLQWGWRVEEIPMAQILWVQWVDALEQPLPLPRIRWPGMVVGRRTSPMGEVEYMAATTERLIAIATENGLFVISPEDPEGFLEAFRRAAEEGTLEAMEARSQRPTRWLGAIWHDRWARGMLLTAWILVFVALIWSNLAASGVAVPGAATQSPAAINRAVLLAIAAWLFQGLNLGLGLFAYQSPQRRAMAYLIWLAGALAAMGFLASVAVVLLGARG